MGRKKTGGGASPPLPISTTPSDGPSPVPPEGPGRRQPVILKQPTRPRCAEVAGSTAAECTAVCCCCPCMLVNLIVLASVRIPVALCRRAREAQAKRKERARKRKEAKLLRAKAGGDGDAVSSPAATEEDVLTAAGGKIQGSPASEVTEMEHEMQAQFHNTGFWRSPSQKSPR